MADFAYVGRLACGCIELVVVDSERARKDASSQMGGLLRRGGTIDRLTMDDARKALREEPDALACPHKEPRKAKARTKDAPPTAQSSFDLAAAVVPAGTSDGEAAHG